MKNRYHVHTYDTDDNKTLNKLRTITDVVFRYPFIFFVRGSTEIYIYNTTNKSIRILKVPTPIVIVSRTMANQYNNFDFTMLLDCGSYFKVATFTEQGNPLGDRYFNIKGAPLYKTDLPKERIKAFYGILKISEKTDKKSE